MSYLPVSESVISPQPPLYFFAVTKIVQIERIKKQLVDFFVPKSRLFHLKMSCFPEKPVIL